MITSGVGHGVIEIKGVSAVSELIQVQSEYHKARSWSDRYLDQVRALIGRHLLRISTEEEDTQQATDLVMLETGRQQIGVRLRRPGYAERYPWDFTIRARVPSGAETELDKILGGAADLFFYGHVNEEGTIHRWFLIDLHVFRNAVIENRLIQRRSREVPNHDGTAGLAFDIRDFPQELLVAASHKVER